MTSVGFRLLKKIAKRGELSLKDAVEFPKAPQDHTAQYPLAMLIEEGYLGLTLDHQPPPGAEKMREYSLAMTLHMFTLPKESTGAVHYQTVRSSGHVDPNQQLVFLKAKGALYLDQSAQKLGSILGILFWSLSGPDCGDRCSGC